MFSDSTSRSSHLEVFCKKDLLKNFAILTGKHLCWSLLLTLLKETPAQAFSRAAFFIEHPWWLFLNFFYLSQKETVFSRNLSVMKTFKCPFLIDLAFIMSIQCSEHKTQLETIFLVAISLLS